MSSVLPVTPFQPVLPPEGIFSEAELDFMDDSPPGLFPENQNSNFGLWRRIYCDRIVELIDQLTTIYNNRFVDTAETYLDEHERLVGLPMNIAGRTVAQRRQDVQTRMIKGPFTRRRRREIVESFLLPSLAGDPIHLTPDGVPLVAAGVPIYGEPGTITSLYRIYENIPGFSYQVQILNSVTPDMPALTRELLRVTPAHISFTIVFVAAFDPDPFWGGAPDYWGSPTDHWGPG